MNPWVLSPLPGYEITGSTPPGFAIDRSPTPEGFINFSFGFSAPGTSGEIELPDAVRARILCFLMLSLIPDEGLKESLETLVGTWQFYRHRTPEALPLPAPKSREAQFGAPYVRPEFSITEE